MTIPTRIQVAVVLSLATAAIHLAVVPEHLDEFAPFGAFFLVAAGVEIAWAAAVVQRPSSELLRVGIGVNLVLAGLWVLSRSVGLPIGPGAGMAEPVGSLDLACTAAEIAIATLAWSVAGAAVRASGPQQAGR